MKTLYAKGLNRDEDAAVEDALWDVYHQLQDELGGGEQMALCLDEQDQLDYFGEIYKKGPWVIFVNNPRSPSGLYEQAFTNARDALYVLFAIVGHLDITFSDSHQNQKLVCVEAQLSPRTDKKLPELGAAA